MLCKLVLVTDPLDHSRRLSGKKPAVFENGGKLGSHIYNQEKHIQDLKISSGIRGGEAVNGGRYWGGNCIKKEWQSKMMALCFLKYGQWTCAFRIQLNSAYSF